MQVVILAAGLGTRMGDLTKIIPKPLLKIEDQTLLERNLQALPSEIDEVVLVVGFLADQIRELIGDYSNNKKVTYVLQTELKGTGHALSLCKDLLRDRFLVLMGDDLYKKSDLEELIKHPLGILVLELQSDDLTQSRHAIVKIDEQGQVLDILERQSGKKGMLVNVGAYILDTSYFDHPLVRAGVPATEFGLPQTMLQMVKDGAKFDIIHATWWHKVATPEDLYL